MRPGDLITELTKQGIEVWAEEDRLRYRAPKGALTPAIMRDLTEHKQDLLRFLTQKDEQTGGALLQEGSSELEQIEVALLEHPNVQEAVATVVSDQFGEKQIVAYVVPFQKNSDQGEGIGETLDWEAFICEGKKRVQAVAVPEMNETVLEVLHSFERVMAQAICNALRESGAYGSANEEYSIDELMQQCSILPRYRRWLSRNLAVLVEKGYLQQSGQRFRCREPLPITSLDEAWGTYQMVSSTLTDPAYYKLLQWMYVTSPQPPAALTQLRMILTEEFHTAELYMSSDTVGYYHFLDHCNLLVRELIAELLRQLPQQTKIRVLEIGAGYGITTAYVLPELPAERVEYHYTDIANYFLGKAREKFAAYPFISYGLLNIDKDPHLQGYPLHHFDLVIATSVLPATASLAESLKHIRRLLASGGMFLFIEETRFLQAFDLNMGLLQGYDRFEDTHLRPTHPLLSREKWLALLEERGFSSLHVFNTPGSFTDFFGLDVFLARAPRLRGTLQDRELYDLLASKLPPSMLPSRIILLEKLPLTASGKVDREKLPQLMGRELIFDLD